MCGLVDTDVSDSRHAYVPTRCAERHEERAVALTEVIIQHAGGSGIAFLWEQQLLNTPVPAHAG